MSDTKGINFQVDSVLYKKIKLHIAENDLKLKEYIINLIKKDLEKESDNNE